MRQIIYILFIALFVSSCAEDNIKSSYRNFPETISLVSEIIPVKDIFMRYPFRIRLSDSCIYMMDLHATEFYCHSFTYPEMKYKWSYGRRGEAPGEFLDAENIRPDNAGTMWILDANKKKLVQFYTEIPDSTKQEVRLSESLIRTLDFDFYNDSLFIVPDYTGNYRYCLVNAQGEPVEFRGRIPSGKKDSSIPAIAFAQAWRSFLNYNPQNGILAMVTQLGEVLEIYDVKNNNIINIVYGKHGEPEFSVSSGFAIPTGIMGYSDVYVGEKYIYALFWGRSFESLKKHVDRVEGGSQIQVFDLRGNPVRQYLLDRHITGFCIDEGKGIIIGLDVNSDQPVVKMRVKN